MIGTYKENMIIDSIEIFASNPKVKNYSQHLDSFIKNDNKMMIKNSLKDEDILTSVIKKALNNSNFEFIKKIIPLIDEKSKLERINIILSDSPPSSNIEKVKEVINLRNQRLESSCTIY